MRFSLRFNSDIGPVQQVLRWVRLADEAGFDAVWYCEDLMQRDAWVVLSAAAVQTRRIRLGTAIVNPYTADPSELAMRAATLQELSGGRFILGIGPGEPSFLRWVGREQARPVTGVREAVLRIRRLLAGEAAPAPAGVFPEWTEEARLRFPLPPQPVPIYIGGQRPKILRLMGELGDGALPILFPPEYAPAAVAHIRQGAAAARRGPGAVEIAGAVWYCVAADPKRAFERLRPLVAFYGPRLGAETLSPIGLSPADFAHIGRLVDAGERAAAERLVTPAMMRLAIVGGPEDVVPRLAWLVRQGVTHLSLGPPMGPDVEEAIRLTAEQVIPAVRSALATAEPGYPAGGAHPTGANQGGGEERNRL